VLKICSGTSLTSTSSEERHARAGLARLDPQPIVAANGFSLSGELLPLMLEWLGELMTSSARRSDRRSMQIVVVGANQTSTP
jgi:hypothetical protein